MPVEIRLEVKAPFKVFGARGVSVGSTTRATNQLLQKVFEDMTPAMLKIAQRDAKSVRERSRGNALGRGPGRKGKLKQHKPLARSRHYQIGTGRKSAVVRRMMHDRTALSSGVTGSKGGSLFSVTFRPSNKLVRYVGNILEGIPEKGSDDVTKKSYARSMRPVTIKPKRRKHLLIPVNNFVRSGEPTSMLGDLLANYQRNTARRYTRMTKGNSYLTDRPSVKRRRAAKSSGFRFLLMGPGTGIGKGLPVKGIYIVHPRERGKRQQKLTLAYALVRSQVIRPRAWFSMGFHRWFHNKGTGRSFNKFAEDLGEEAAKAFVATWNRESRTQRKS